VTKSIFTGAPGNFDRHLKIVWLLWGQLDMHLLHPLVNLLQRARTHPASANTRDCKMILETPSVPIKSIVLRCYHCYCKFYKSRRLIANGGREVRI
jgi:hypothetical protein